MMRKVSAMQSEKGFTLVELMIVVAIIGILAAIAIPQFAAYRIRGFNSSALSDLRGLATSQAAFFADFSGYGVTDTAVVAALTATGANPVLTGPIAPAAAATSGLHQFLRAASQFITIPLGNGTSIAGKSDVATAQSFTAVSKHTRGNTWYGVDGDVTSIYAAAGVDTDVTLAVVAADVPASTVGVDDLNGAAITLGSTPNFAKM